MGLTGRMANRYGGPCDVCLRHVKVSRGIVIRDKSGTWRLYHQTHIPIDAED